MSDDQRYKVDPETGCWEWQRGKTKQRYGALRVDGRFWLAHRYFYVQHRGEIPVGLVLDHVVCDNRGCCNPWHVEPTTREVNTARSVARLTREQVDAMRASTESHADLAEHFGVTAAHVSRVRKRTRRGVHYV